MPCFELSYMTPGASTTAIRSLFALVDDFNHTHPLIDVQVNNMPWLDAWQQLMRMAIYRKGPDLSEIGAPWTSDFVGMNSLRPFQPAEIDRLGGENSFAPVAWQNCQINESHQAWGIPARVDVRVIFYWRDMIEQAGIDPSIGFSTPELFAESMERLRAAGFEQPFTTFTEGARFNVYHSASWIWASGGELVDADGNIAFHQPAARQGLCEFFNLQRYLNTADLHPDQIFLSRKAAVIMAGQWILGRVRRKEALSSLSDLNARLGVALPPGPTFVGGTNLVIWSHTAQENARAALELIEQLVTSPAYPQLCIDTDFLPPNLAALAGEQLAGDPHYSVLVEALRLGRTHASAHLWLLLAERLGAAMTNLWDSLRQAPNQDIESQVMQLTETVAARLEQTLSVK